MVTVDPILSLLSILMVMVSAKPLDDVDNWVSFVAKFGRQYGSQAESTKRLDFWLIWSKNNLMHVQCLYTLFIRQAIFQANLALITKHNQEAKQGLHNYMLAVNKFADLVSLKIRPQALISFLWG